MRKLSNDKSTGIKIKHFPLKLEMKNYKILEIKVTHSKNLLI